MKKLIKKFYTLFVYRTQLSAKLLLSYAVLIIIPLLFLTFLSYAHVSKMLIRQFQDSSDISLQQTSAYLDRVLREVIDATQQAAYHKTLANIYQKNASAGQLLMRYQDYQTASDVLGGIFSSEDIHSAEIFVSGKFTFANSKGIEGLSFINLNSAQAQMLDESLKDFHGKILWFPPHIIKDAVFQKETVVITGARYMKVTPTNRNIGIITVNIPQHQLDAIISRASTLSGSVSLLFDNTGNSMSVSDEALLQSYGLTADRILEGIDSGLTTLTIQNNTILLNHTSVGDSGWILVSANPYDKILEPSIETRNRMLLTMLLVSILFLFTAWFISRLVTKPIRFLAKRMKEVQFHNYDPIPVPAGTDEVSDLVNSYNHMLDKINAYAASQYQQGIALKNSELKTLQAQINPHFLYNTLDLLHWLAVDYGADEISEIVSLLSRFYKLSLNRGLDIVSLRDALTHTEVYIRLQNFRFDQPVSLEIQVPEEIRNCGILNLILQPIVENAILHGIREKESQTGTVTIRAFVSENILHLEIADDGIGMDESQLEALLHPSDKNASTGYGIWNIMERIRLYYGAEYGLTYESRPGKGTTAFLRIPYIEG